MPALDKMFKDAHKKLFDVVLFWDLHIPAQTCHPFRLKPATHSGRNLPAIPV